MMSKFIDEQNKHQSEWRKQNVDSKELGTQNGYRRKWILPKQLWEQGLWSGIRSDSDHSLSRYLDDNKIQKHSGVHNLKSSWVLTANVYFAHRRDPSVLVGFLKNHICEDIVDVIDLELEWTGEGALNPAVLLGERGGNRGANQTSPDIAFIVRLKNGHRGIILTEVKFTEHSFYRCSGRDKKNGNPDPRKCLSAELIVANPQKHCYLANWESLSGRENRRYWEYIDFNEASLNQLRYCPAAVAGYQLFRQQSYAEAIARRGEYQLVVSCVAYDKRNQTLERSLNRTGVTDLTTDWGTLFNGKTQFRTFTHQEWIRFVADSTLVENWREWLSWISERYAFEI